MLGIAKLSMAHVHAGGYVDQIQRNPHAELRVVWDDDPERGRPAAERYGVPYSADLEAVLSRSDVDAVAVDAETSKHTDVLIAAAEHRKHIFTEKALTVTLADAEKVVQAVREAGIVFTISLPQRTRPETQFAKKALDGGWLGKVTLMRARIAHNAALDRWFSGGSAWFGDKTLAGGGSLFDLGCHTVDLMRYLLGEPESVSAVAQNLTGAYDIDDQCVALVRFKSGALGILDVSWVHRAGPNTTEIYGTEGFLGWGYPGAGMLLNSSHVLAEGMQGTLSPTGLPRALPSPLDSWIEAIRTGSPTVTTVEDGRNLTEMLEGIYKSAASSQVHRF
jgi:1,5-anhydro-D-fructose reductase (1,5-anhydro-D-mannitol-forming)